ncbi:MAG: ATP-dependent Clp protease adaptor ClpS [Rhodothermales bacterium]|nr:ATP-dependent Clp protease adaptor ClpS [Rhodothermales bacterium]
MSLQINAYTRLYYSWPQLSAVPEADTQTEVETLVEEDDGTSINNPWRVILFNDAVHTFDDVINQLMKATGCSSQHAEQIAWTVHTKGKALAYEGKFEECFRVQAVLREIQLITEIEG